LEILLKFIQWKIRDPKTMNILLYVFNLLIDYYIVMYGRSNTIDTLFKNILEVVKEEIEFEKKLLETSSKIESLNSLYNYSYVIDNEEENIII
jgi:hypothetical protein